MPDAPTFGRRIPAAHVPPPPRAAEPRPTPSLAEIGFEPSADDTEEMAAWRAQRRGALARNLLGFRAAGLLLGVSGVAFGAAGLALPAAILGALSSGCVFLGFFRRRANVR